MFRYKNISIVSTTEDYNHSTLKNLGLSEYASVECQQIHSSTIHHLIKADLKTNHLTLAKCDGIITDQHPIHVMIKTADCIPLILFDEQATYIAAIHAGWRGLVDGIHIKAIDKLSKMYTKPKLLHAYIGPCIRSCCYRFPDKPKQSDDKAWKPFIFQKEENWHETKLNWHIDLVGFLKQQLIDNGMQPKSIHDSYLCSYHHAHLASHLRSKHLSEPTGTIRTIVQLE